MINSRCNERLWPGAQPAAVAAPRAGLRLSLCCTTCLISIEHRTSLPQYTSQADEEIWEYDHTGVMKAPGTKRLAVIASTLVYIILGVPVWWYTTSLHRPPLPHSELAAAAAASQQRSAVLPVALDVVLALPSGQQLSSPVSAKEVLQSIQHAVKQQHLEVQVQLSVTVNAAGKCSRCAAATVKAGSSADIGRQCQQQQPCSDLLHMPVPISSTNEKSQQQIDEWLSQQDSHCQLLQLGDHCQNHQQQEQVSGTNQSFKCSAVGSIPGRYVLYLLPATSKPAEQPNSQEGSTVENHAIVGKHRHAWMAYDAEKTLKEPQVLLDAAAAAAVQVFDCCFALHTSKAAVNAAADLPISAGGHTHLSFSLLNAEPSAGEQYAWHFEAFERRYLAFVAARLAPVTQVSVESQVLLYTPARTHGSWSDKHSAYVVKQAELPFFIDSDWSLESGRAVLQQDCGFGGCTKRTQGAQTSSETAGADSSKHTVQQSSIQAALDDQSRSAAALPPHVLHFLVYIPPKRNRPLLLLGPKAKQRDSNSFWIPSWGGLSVLNPEEALDAAVQQQTASQSSNRVSWEPVKLHTRQYQQIAAVANAQLQALFGVSPTASSAVAAAAKVQQLPAGLAGFSDWQVDALLRQRAGYDVTEAARVLGSLSKLVLELPNLEMPDVIGQQVQQALSYINTAWQHIAAGDYHAAAAAAGAARAAAEAAFSHPAVLAQLNFPESHKLGVYMPLFLPVSVPILQGLIRQVAHYVSRHREFRATQLSRQ
eukprot:GHRR01014116.1.p1 GENE.GHRR01014116.1~~GHRR01014116.1.p1  ORF type:complete len:763 (+),score=295.93 GHRR01014116.1:423-2711(+)